MHSGVARLVALLAAAVLALAGAGPAAAEGTGSIAGTVTVPDGYDVTAVGVEVSADGMTVGWSPVQPDGTYLIGGLADGEYQVAFDGAGLLRQYWPGGSEWYDALPVAVVGGGAVTGIDAVLAAGGSIAGTVTVPAGQDVTSVMVRSSADDGSGGGYAFVQPDGTYTMTGLAPGSYRVEFEASGTALIHQYFPGTQDWSAATLVPVSAGTTTAGIDATMVAGGSIAGTVTAGGAPVDGAWVIASAGDLTSLSALTGPDGRYTVVGLPAGAYTVQVWPAEGSGLVGAYWPGVLALADATAVEVAEGGLVEAVDLDLSTGGTITGHVLDVSGAPIASAEVTAYLPDQDGLGLAWTSATTWTAEDGSYTLAGVADRPVLLVASGPDGATVRQYWPGVLTAAEATTLQVAEGQTLTDVDVVLPPAGHITGTVALPDWADYYCVRAEDGAAAQASTCAAAGESFDLGGLPAGEYLVWIGDEGPGGMAPALYHPGTMRPSQAVRVPLASGASVEITIDASALVVRGSAEPQVDLAVGPAVAGGPADVVVTLAGDPTPTGVVLLHLNGSPIGDAELVDGVARFSPTFTAADDGGLLSVRYLGDPVYAEGYAEREVEVAAAVPTVLELTSTPDPVRQGDVVTLTAAVRADDGSVPSGEVTVTEGAIVLGAAALVDGVAELTVEGLTPGVHLLTASYAGSTAHLGSTATIEQEVTAAARPRVAAIRPRTGPASGGTTVSLRGTGFTGVTSVTFDGRPGTDLLVLDDHRITVTAPHGQVGPARVVVRGPGGASRSVTFVYLPVRHRWR